MEANRRMGRMAGLAVTVLVGWGLLAGCESVTQYDSSIQVNPDSVTLTNVGGTQVFVAEVQTPVGDTALSTNTALFLPLVWTVSDSSLGTIRASGAFSAIYERHNRGPGNNYITVRDQGQAEGVAVVNQPEVPDEPETNATPTVITVVTNGT